MTSNFQLLCMGLLIFGIVLSVLINIVFGGFVVGKLTRRLEVIVPGDQFNAFLARMHQRLAELNFQTESSGSFFQHGTQFGVPTSYTHAKSAKRLEVTADQSNPQAIKVRMAVHFIELIVGDTGESAYADAVMKYISNETHSMQPVANRSFLAFSSLVLSIWTWLVLVALKVLHIEPCTPTVMTLSVTTVFTSIVAIVSIALKPKELRGLWLAIAGLVISGLALMICLALGVLKNLS